MRKYLLYWVAKSGKEKTMYRQYALPFETLSETQSNATETSVELPQ